MQGSSREKVLIVGAGGLGREAHQYALSTLDGEVFEIVGYLDDAPERLGGQGITLALPVVGDVHSHAPAPEYRYLMAIGDSETRSRVTQELLAKGAAFLTIIHPMSYVATSAKIGLGCIVAPFATVGAGAILEPFTHLHFYASSAHDTRVGPFASLSPYAVANGQSSIGECAFLGTRAIVNPVKKVGAHAKVTAGSVVYRDVPARSIADGNPAKSRPLLSFGNHSGGPASEEGSSNVQSDSAVGP